MQKQDRMTEQDKRIKELLRGNFDEPSPSPDFTKKIMQNITASAESQEQNGFKYVPVISNSGWIFVCVLFLPYWILTMICSLFGALHYDSPA